MRLNDGAPVWHASISIRTPDLRLVRSAGVAERHAVRLLAGVGNDREWWYWNPAVAVGHLRVGLTPAEVAMLPELPAEHDAGPSGPERRRTPPRGRQ
ncbi:MAG: hypothetical protein ACREN2_13490 [Candidatus Dormibacteria bacterium]